MDNIRRLRLSSRVFHLCELAYSFASMSSFLKSVVFFVFCFTLK